MPLMEPVLEYAFVHCVQKAACDVIAELCEREMQRLEHELACMIAGGTLPRTWGNPEQFQ